MDLNQRPQRKKTLPLRFQDLKIDNKMKPDIITNRTKRKNQLPAKFCEPEQIAKKAKSVQKSIDNKRKTKIPTSEPGQIPKKVKVDSTVIATDHPVLEQPMMDLEEHSQNQELNGVKSEILVNIHESTVYLRIY